MVNRMDENSLHNETSRMAGSVVKKNCAIPTPLQKLDYATAKKQRESWLNAEMRCYAEFENSKAVKGLTSESICIDCGANIGKISEIMAKTGAMVYAFEPNPLCMFELEELCSKYENIKLIKKGVADRNSKFKMYHNDFICFDREVFSQSSSIYSSKKNVNIDNFSEIECIDLCEFINNIGKHIDILKLDVEGAEYDILFRMITTEVYRKCRLILVEQHANSIPEVVERAKIVKRLIEENNIDNIDMSWC